MRRRPVLVVAGLLALHLLLALLTFEPRPHTGGDNAAYITLGRSLIEHGTYTELWDPAEPPHTKYPPVFPALLGLAMLIGLKPWVQLKLLVVACSAAAVVFSFLWIRARNRPGLALGVATIIAIAPGVLREGRWVLSDVPFWAFTMIALWAFERLRPDDWKRFAIAAVATLLAYFTRSAGLPLVLAALLWLAWRRSFKQLGALALIVGIPAVLWWLRGRAFGPAGYVSEFWLINPYLPAEGRIGVAELLARVGINAQKYASIHMPVLLSGAPGGLLLAVSISAFVLAAVGWLWRVRRARVPELFLPLYIGLIFVWPDVWSGERFLLPALSMLLFYAGEAVVRLLHITAPRLVFSVPVAAMALLVVLALPGLARAVVVGRDCTQEYLAGERYPCLGGPWREYFQLAEQTGAMLPDGSAILTRKPRLFYLLSEVKSRPIPLNEDVDAFFASADSAGARYVIFDRLDALAMLYVRPALMQRPEAFCVLRAEPGGSVLFGIRTTGVEPAEATAQGERIAFDFCGDEYWRSPEARRTYEQTR